MIAHQIDDPVLVRGVNDRQQLAEVARELNDRIVRRWRLAGVTIQDATSTWIDVTVELGQDVTLLPGTQLRGTTVVQDEATVGPDTTLIDTEVGFGADVTRVHAISARIGENAHVGPFSYLRPGTVLGAEGKIGTFVETKNVTIGRGAKVPHLSYAGDAEIGEGRTSAPARSSPTMTGCTSTAPRWGRRCARARTTCSSPRCTSARGSTRRRHHHPQGRPGRGVAITQAPQVNREGWVAEHRAGTASADAAEVALQHSGADENDD